MTVKEIKAQLKTSFPGTKFQVRTIRETIYISWTDGAGWTSVNRLMGDHAYCSRHVTKEEQDRLVTYCRQNLQGSEQMVIDSQMMWAEMHMENPGADSITVSWR